LFRTFGGPVTVRAILTTRDSVAWAAQRLASLEEVLGHHPAEALRLCEEIQRIAPGTRGNEDCIRRNHATLAASGGSQ
jgi:hypothetical protein